MLKFDLAVHSYALAFALRRKKFATIIVINYVTFQRITCVPRRYFFCGSFVLLIPCIFHALASVHCCLVINCWEMAIILALVCDV